MKKIFLSLAIAITWFLALFFVTPCHATEKSTRLLSSGDFSCASSTMTPTQVFPNRPNRTGYMIANLASANIRVSFGSSFTVLSSTNSIQLLPNSAVTDQIPSVTTLPLFCQSLTTTPQTLSVLEFGQ